MSPRTIDLLRALAERSRDVDELAARFRVDDPEMRQLLDACQLANVATRSDGKWLLTRQGRRLLEAHDRRRENPGRLALEYMMRGNTGIAAAR